MGLARTGLSTVRFLTARGADVIVSDIREESALEKAAEEARMLGAALDLGRHSEERFRSADLIIVSPGIPWRLPALETARRDGIPVMSEIELAIRFLKGRIAGITGTNGKTTTTALAAAMLSASGLSARACGNIGTPLLEMVGGDSESSVYAVELSSFQLEGIIRFRPAAAVVVNLSPDHLDRYADYAGYAAAKARIFANQEGDDIAILNAADPDSSKLRSAVKVRLRQFSSLGPVEDGAFLHEGHIILAGQGRTEPLMPAGEVPLPGRHNLENVMAAALAALHLGASAPAIRRAVATFRSLPHRLEHVGQVDGVDYYNDSKATNVGATITSLESFPHRRVLIILGGRDKGGDFTQLRPLLERRATAVLLIGEATELIERQIAGAAPIVRTGQLAAAVAEARRLATSGDVVLLAPGCASFDQYHDYEERGDHFRSLVAALGGGAGGPGGPHGTEA